MSYWLSLLSIITLFSYLYIWSAIYGDGLCFEYSFGIMWWIGSSISFYLFYEEEINGSVELICCFVSFYFIGSFVCSGYNCCLSSITTSLLSILFLSYNWLLSFSTLSFMFLDILSIAFAASITFYIFPAASLNILKSSSVGSFL